MLFFPFNMYTFLDFIIIIILYIFSYRIIIIIRSDRFSNTIFFKVISTHLRQTFRFFYVVTLIFIIFTFCILYFYLWCWFLSYFLVLYHYWFIYNSPNFIKNSLFILFILSILATIPTSTLQHKQRHQLNLFFTYLSDFLLMCPLHFKFMQSLSHEYFIFLRQWLCDYFLHSLHYYCWYWCLFVSLHFI